MFLIMGQLLAMAIVYSGKYLQLMPRPVYEFIGGRALSSIKVNTGDVPDPTIVLKCNEARYFFLINFIHCNLSVARY